ncbi:hypothetical protein BKA60DRAFT_647131 [Fusarium oxysporum]|nr:hypothetical protein BKA60DRAFT_647131 [Fusarium oxysporum]
MTPKLSSARKRGRPSLNGASSSPDYPTQRALHAAQRIHQACGMWPTEFCKGFVPETWGIRLIEGLSALVSLVVAAENVELDEVRHRLKVFATSHPRSDRPRLLDEDETADSEGTEANSEPIDEIIALGPREDLGEYEDEDKEETEEDPDLTVEEEESAPHERNLWSRNRDIGDIPDDEPMEDTMAANPRSAPAKPMGNPEAVLSPPAPAPTQPSQALALGATFNHHLAWFMIPPRGLFAIQRDQMNKFRRLLLLQLRGLFKARRSRANHQAPKRWLLSPLLSERPGCSTIWCATAQANSVICSGQSSDSHVFSCDNSTGHYAPSATARQPGISNRGSELCTASRTIISISTYAPERATA